MRMLSPVLLVALLAGSPCRGGDDSLGPRNFVFFNVERERIRGGDFLETDALVGAQLKYTWRELEPEPGRYELQPVLDDLRFLEAHGKRLFVQLQDVSFDERINVPNYLIEDPAYGGGVARKYEFEGDDESRPVFDGWVARRWDPAVIDRFKRLLQALGQELDGKIEGLNLAETSIGFGDGGALHPAGYTFERYAEGVKAIMSAAREAFPRSHVIQYANFMPGEWLPWNDNGYLRGVYEHAARIGVGVGGPDLLPHRRGQRNHSYKLIAARDPGVTAGLAVQWGNLADRDPVTGEPVTVAQLHRFARDSLRLDYLFWGTQEPYYSDQVLPYLRRLTGDDRRVVPVGLFIAAIEEGARIFTPVRLLPFDHPESEAHEFPNALQLHQSEYEALVWLGERVGLKLAATLQRYPRPPVPEWWYEAFEEVPVEKIKEATIHRMKRTTSPISGLKAVVFYEGQPICFLVDTRGLTLEERGMSRPTTMGLDLRRAQFLAGLEEVGRALAGEETSVVVFED